MNQNLTRPGDLVCNRAALLAKNCSATFHSTFYVYFPWRAFKKISIPVKIFFISSWSNFWVSHVIGICSLFIVKDESETGKNVLNLNISQPGKHNSLMDDTIPSWFILRVCSIKETMSHTVKTQSEHSQRFPRVKRISESFCGTPGLTEPTRQPNQSSLEIDRDVSQQSCHSITEKYLISSLGWLCFPLIRRCQYDWESE